MNGFTVEAVTELFQVVAEFFPAADATDSDDWGRNCLPDRHGVDFAFHDGQEPSLFDGINDGGVEDAFCSRVSLWLDIIALVFGEIFDGHDEAGEVMVAGGNNQTGRRCFVVIPDTAVRRSPVANEAAAELAQGLDFETTARIFWQTIKISLSFSDVRANHFDFFRANSSCSDILSVGAQRGHNIGAGVKFIHYAVEFLTFAVRFTVEIGGNAEI